MRYVFALLLTLVTLLSPLNNARALAADCQFVLGFQSLHDLIPNIVGDCLVNEHHNPDNGDGLQETTGVHGAAGLLVWRKHDNWTAYTDGYRTWINGPQGLQERLNSQLFPWESPPPTAPMPVPTLPPATPAPPSLLGEPQVKTDLRSVDVWFNTSGNIDATVTVDARQGSYLYHNQIDLTQAYRAWFRLNDLRPGTPYTYVISLAGQGKVYQGSFTTPICVDTGPGC